MRLLKRASDKLTTGLQLRRRTPTNFIIMLYPARKKEKVEKNYVRKTLDASTDKADDLKVTLLIFSFQLTISDKGSR